MTSFITDKVRKVLKEDNNFLTNKFDIQKIKSVEWDCGNEKLLRPYDFTFLKNYRVPLVIMFVR